MPDHNHNPSVFLDFPPQEEHHEDAPNHLHMHDMVVFDDKPTESEVLEVYQDEDPSVEVECEPSDENGFEVGDSDSLSEIDKKVPGAPEDAQDDLVVSDDQVDAGSAEDKQEKKTDPWDWSKCENFMSWVQDRLDHIPRNTGFDRAGLERTMSYLDKLDSEISKAMRADHDGKLDADEVAEVVKKIESGKERLEERLDQVTKKRKKKASPSNAMVKEGKSTPINGIVVTVPLLISRIARVCINGNVSAGHDIEDLFDRQCEKYDLDKREQAELLQLLEDMGYPMNRDRGFLVDEKKDPASSDNFDHSAHYKA